MFWKLEHVFRSLRPVRRLPQPPRWRTRLALEALEARRLLSTYTVTTTADGVPGSLREAIYQVDHTPDVDTIEFRLGAGDHTIHLGSPLDPITHYVYIHGTTAADGFVELEGSGAGAGANGLVFQVGTPDMSEVDGLAIVRFGQDGILIRSGGPVEVSGCFIGTDPMGAVGLGNGGDGVAIVNSSTNVIGLTGAGPGNIISGNRQNGVHLSGNTTAGNVIQGNIIGLNPQGTASLGNSGSGVLIELNAAGNRVGGTDPGYRNVISANGQNGITIFDHSSTDNLVQGNYIGTDANGAIALGNIHDGIRVDGGARSNTIGGQEDGARNVISGNGEDGAAILGTGTSGNLLAGNYVGIDASGTYAISNASRCSGECLGVRVGIINASGNMVDGNVISGNIKGGLSLDNGAFNNVVTNNLIGTTPDGNSALGNSQKGIIIQSGAHNNSVRGNLISGNMGAGLNLFANETRNNIIQGNLIGTDLTGTLPLPNTNEGIFILVSDTSNNTIGGTTDGAGNVISGNRGNGITIVGGGVVAQGNWIGTDASGTLDLGNGADGIHIANGASNNVIGGTDPGAANTIAFNGGVGVQVGQNAADLALGNSIRGNAIYANGALGIDLAGDGVTPNHDCNQTPGPNNWQNYPILSSVQSGDSTEVTGTLNSQPDTSFILDFYASGTPDPSGHGQAERYLDSATVTTDDSCNATFDVILNAPTGAGEFVSATATDPNGNTSEFAADIAATSPQRDLVSESVLLHNQSGFLLPIRSDGNVGAPHDDDFPLAACRLDLLFGNFDSKPRNKDNDREVVFIQPWARASDSSSSFLMDLAPNELGSVGSIPGEPAVA